MNDKKKLHNAYHKYRIACQSRGIFRIGYEEWLEHTLANALVKLDELNDELVTAQAQLQVDTLAYHLGSHS